MNIYKIFPKDSKSLLFCIPKQAKGLRAADVEIAENHFAAKILLKPRQGASSVKSGCRAGIALNPLPLPEKCLWAVLAQAEKLAYYLETAFFAAEAVRSPGGCNGAGGRRKQGCV